MFVTVQLLVVNSFGKLLQLCIFHCSQERCLNKAVHAIFYAREQYRWLSHWRVSIPSLCSLMNSLTWLRKFWSMGESTHFLVIRCREGSETFINGQSDAWQWTCRSFCLPRCSAQSIEDCTTLGQNIIGWLTPLQWQTEMVLKDTRNRRTWCFVTLNQWQVPLYIRFDCLR